MSYANCFVCGKYMRIRSRQTCGRDYQKYWRAGMLHLLPQDDHVGRPIGTEAHEHLCKNDCGRTAMTSADICGPCFAGVALADFVQPHYCVPPNRRGVCKHCGKERQVDGRGLCEYTCAKLGLGAQYPVVRGRGRPRKETTHG